MTSATSWPSVVIRESRASTRCPTASMRWLKRASDSVTNAVTLISDSVTNAVTLISDSVISLVIRASDSFMRWFSSRKNTRDIVKVSPASPTPTPIIVMITGRVSDCILALHWYRLYTGSIGVN